jgi:hypothetical protein
MSVLAGEFHSLTTSRFSTLPSPPSIQTNGYYTEALSSSLNLSKGLFMHVTAEKVNSQKLSELRDLKKERFDTLIKELSARARVTYFYAFSDTMWVRIVLSRVVGISYH